MTSYSVHIKIADRGWILEKCAREISGRRDNISFGLGDGAGSDLTYYVNYSARTGRVSPVEVAFFTHSELDPNARRRYFDAASQVDHCVCMSERYATELTDWGIEAKKISVISPGVDLDSFKPRIKIGVVGRTYHTGRKGEALVAQVMDIEGIEWRFTGSGWPGPAQLVPEGQMPTFYQDLDYLLVPASYEGGPMSVLEALASGVPVISSDVGWVNQYPHIPFENGNADSLRAVLEGLVQKQLELREAVQGRSWEHWAAQHFDLFDRLISASLNATTQQARLRSSVGRKPSVTLITHGNEGVTLGGPSVRVPRTQLELSKIGVKNNSPADTISNWDDNPIAHIFNVWPAQSCFKMVERAKNAGKSVVLSPIFLNLSNHQLYSNVIPHVFVDHSSPRVIDSSLAAIARTLDEEPNVPIREPFGGYHELVQACVERADHIIHLSEYERKCLDHIGASSSEYSLIKNPVDAAVFSSADPELFRERYGMENFILCVGRIEPRKNQLLVAYAAKKLGKKIVFIGHDGNSGYAALVKKIVGDDGFVIPRIDPKDPMLRSAFGAAGVFCLPSWSEGAPLAALEAASAGLPMVLSDRSSEQEYFGNFASYSNPSNINQLCAQLEVALERRGDTERRESLVSFMKENHSWERHVEDTASVYSELAGVCGATPSGALDASAHGEKTADEVDLPIYLDLTSTFHANGNPTGIARVENRAFLSLVDLYGDRIVPILWNSSSGNFLRLRHYQVLSSRSLEKLNQDEQNGNADVIRPSTLRRGKILVLGGAWIRNATYIGCLGDLKNISGSQLTVLVHDLIQMRMGHIYPPGVSDEFTKNMDRLSEIADSYLVYSEATQSDLHHYLLAKGHIYSRIDKFKLGDMSEAISGEPVAAGKLPDPRYAEFAGRDFIIYVSSLEIRKNHGLLINIWRRLIEQKSGRTPHLLFIGRPLWRGEEIVDLVRREPRLASYIHILNDVDDNSLDWFYRNCRFTLFPSLYEGWGLPVAESMGYGKMCIASSAASLPEVAPGYADCIDPYDFRAWYDRINLYLDNPSLLGNKERAIKEAFQLDSWEDAVTTIIRCLDDIVVNNVSLPTLFVGQGLNFFKNAPGGSEQSIFAAGWSHIEKSGRWSIGQRSSLKFRYVGAGDYFYIRFLARAFTRPGEASRKLRVVLNDTIAVDELFLPSQFVETNLKIPKPELGETVILTFEFDDVFSPVETGAGPDTRQLGMHIVSATLAGNLEGLATPTGPGAPTASVAENISTPSVALTSPRKSYLLMEARHLITLPDRYSGRRPVAKILRRLSIDKILLKIQKNNSRRSFQSIEKILDYLES